MNARVSIKTWNSSFTTKLVRPEGVGTWTFAPIPTDISDHADLKAKTRVRSLIDGVPLSSSLMAGSGELFIVIAKELRDNNPRAELVGIFTDRVVQGTASIGIGGNKGIGGTNETQFGHEETLRKPTLTLDGYTLVNNGRIQL
ncbi:DUF1905 domain-containing protein [Candidatus Bathyarchaeota archaeon]|nr:MAG: DUF1905 domain-containing protein [Candidatus Bathyarchaeota archaeon]